MGKKMVTFTEEMEEVIQREASRRGAPFALIVREAIVEWAQKRGITLERDVAWGGTRRSSEEVEKKSKETKQGENVAVAAG